MLGIMRKYKESIVIKLVFGVIVLSFIGTIFLVWGRGDKDPSGSLTYAAKVDGTKISLDEFTKSYYRLRSVYEQLYGRSLTPEMEKQLGLKKQALDSLVDAVLVRKAARSMGVAVSKDEIQAAVAAVPAFQKDGAFDFQQYLATLKANRITPNDFEESQKEELLVKKARQKIKDQAAVSDEEAQQQFHKRNDKVELAYAAFSPAELEKEEDFRIIAKTDAIPLCSVIIDRQKVSDAVTLRLQKALLELSGENAPETMLSKGFVKPARWTPVIYNVR